MNILFLDIDGVLNSEDYYVQLHKIPGYELCRHNFSQIDRNAVERLVIFLKETGVKLVISSGWRYSDLPTTLEHFDKEINLSKIVPYIVGVTGRYRTPRGEEIAQFLKNDWKDPSYSTIDQIDKYAIVDDDKDMLEEQLPYFIHILNTHGLLNTHIVQLKKLFS